MGRRRARGPAALGRPRARDRVLTPAPRPRGRARRAVVPAALLGAFAAAAYSAAQGFLNVDVLRLAWGAAAAPLLGLDAAGAAAAAAALARERARPPRGGGEVASALALGAVLLAAWVAAYQAFSQPYSRIPAEVSLGLAAGAFALAVLADLPRRVPRAVRRGALAACAAAAGLELAFAAVAAVHPSPLTATPGTSSEVRLAVQRLAPGTLRFGTPCNAGGFYDGEFLPPERRARPAVAVVGDSFGVGVVPHAFHYTTVAERALGVDVYNLGVSAVGPDEYRLLLEREALPLAPAAVVVTLFAGNDLADVAAEGWSDRALRRLLDRESLLLRVVPPRLLALRAAPAPAPPRAAAGGAAAPAPEVPPWVGDPLREPPTFSPRRHLDLDALRAQIACRPHARRLAALEERLAELRAACGGVPFGLALWPAEFQVEDAHWAAVVERLGAPRDLLRDRLQAEVAAWCRANGVPLLDLLPALRAEPPLADGNRHLYHLRDTHFNARGNAVAGRALAEFVAGLLEAPAPPGS